MSLATNAQDRDRHSVRLDEIADLAREKIRAREITSRDERKKTTKTDASRKHDEKESTVKAANRRKHDERNDPSRATAVRKLVARASCSRHDCSLSPSPARSPSPPYHRRRSCAPVPPPLEVNLRREETLRVALLPSNSVSADVVHVS